TIRELPLEEILFDQRLLGKGDRCGQGCRAERERTNQDDAHGEDPFTSQWSMHSVASCAIEAVAGGASWWMAVEAAGLRNYHPFFVVCAGCQGGGEVCRDGIAGADDVDLAPYGVCGNVLSTTRRVSAHDTQLGKRDEDRMAVLFCEMGCAAADGINSHNWSAG